MFTVASLLNPLPPEEPSFAHQPSTPRSPRSDLDLPSPKKPKMSKSNSTFVKAKPKGQINYKPCEIQDDVTRMEHQKFQVKPIGSISEHPRHIPYNSEKKSFQEKTGRDAFEVFQYTFRMPGEDRTKEPHVVMWDYNVGLVRITSFFKSLKHSKTMPAKVMSANPGLKDISHSITGGSISAQGYWVPYEAARAIAATFCWEIRYVLTPVFGLSFPDDCTHPEDPLFLRISIEKGIIRHCTEMAHAILEKSQGLSTKFSPRTPYFIITPKSLRPKPPVRHDYESGYCTDTDRSLPNSPQSSCIEWTSVNMPRSFKHHESPDPISGPASSESTSNKPIESPREIREGTNKRIQSNIDRGSECVTSERSSSLAVESPAKRMKAFTLSEEARAAYTLMQLHMADETLAANGRAIRRRASH